MSQPWSDLIARTQAIAAQARESAPAKRQANRDSDPQWAAWADHWTGERIGGVLMWIKWPDGREWRK